MYPESGLPCYKGGRRSPSLPHFSQNCHPYHSIPRPRVVVRSPLVTLLNDTEIVTLVCLSPNSDSVSTALPPPSPPRRNVRTSQPDRSDDPQRKRYPLSGNFSPTNSNSRQLVPIRSATMDRSIPRHRLGRDLGRGDHWADVPHPHDCLAPVHGLRNEEEETVRWW